MVSNDKVYQIVLHLVLMILCIITILPFIVLITSSLTAEQSLIANGYSLGIKQFSLDAYRFIFRDESIFKAYGMSFLVTALGTFFSLIVTTLLAYVLSVRDLPGKWMLSFYVFFTMLFSGGLVPSYMMWTQVFHIKNSIWAYLLPNLVTNGFTVMIMRSYFQSNIPLEVLESARMDGANEFFILRKIILPMSLPILATIGLMSGIGYWNDWTNGLYYVTEKSLNTVQTLLNNMLTNAQYLQQTAAYGSSGFATLPTTAARMAVAVVGALPLMLVYPFFQKYFVKGLTLGAVKA